MFSKKTLLFGCILVLILGCQKSDDNALREKSKQEIIQTEREFNAMAANKGLAEAFAYFAADNAVLNRHNLLVTGKDNIKKIYEDAVYKTGSLKWAPDFVDASLSGDLGYTYGQYIFSAKDSSGKIVESKGYFHTVWKKQSNGKWKFVWD